MINSSSRHFRCLWLSFSQNVNFIFMYWEPLLHIHDGCFPLIVQNKSNKAHQSVVKSTSQSSSGLLLSINLFLSEKYAHLKLYKEFCVTPSIDCLAFFFWGAFIGAFSITNWTGASVVYAPLRQTWKHSREQSNGDMKNFQRLKFGNTPTFFFTNACFAFVILEIISMSYNIGFEKQVWLLTLNAPWKRNKVVF